MKKTLNYTARISLALASLLSVANKADARTSDAGVSAPSGLEQKVNDVNDVNEVKIKYTPQDLKELQNILYAEAANQPRKARKLITRLVLNRAKSNDYPSSIHGVLYKPKAFSCINDKNNLNWKQAIGKTKRNEYEEKIYRRCFEDANSVLNGEIIGVPDEDKIIAYHDKTIDYNDLVNRELKIQEKFKEKGKVYKGYWMNLEPVTQEGNLIFYKEKTKKK